MTPTQTPTAPPQVEITRDQLKDYTNVLWDGVVRHSPTREVVLKLLALFMQDHPDLPQFQTPSPIEPDWIRTKDRLPTEADCRSLRYTVLWALPGTGTVMEDNFKSCRDATHWMPLPLAPEPETASKPTEDQLRARFVKLLREQDYGTTLTPDGTFYDFMLEGAYQGWKLAMEQEQDTHGL